MSTEPSDAAVEAAAEAMARVYSEPGINWPSDFDAADEYRREARVVLSAALPIIREELGVIDE